MRTHAKVIKNTEGGVSAVCEVMQKYEKIAADKERISLLTKLYIKGSLSLAEAAEEANLTEEEFSLIANASEGTPSSLGEPDRSEIG